MDIIENFNPRAPYGARLRYCILERRCELISIHAPHTGRDSMIPARAMVRFYFNPRAPYGARLARALAVRSLGISIHAPHTGRDRIGTWTS